MAKNVLSAEEREAILKDATSDFVDAFTTIKSYFVDENNNVIRARYNQGLAVLELTDPKNQKKYGRNSVTRMAAALGVERSHLQNCKTFAERVEEDEMEEILSARTSGGHTINWSHVTVLYRFTERSEREHALSMLVVNDWTFQQFKDWRDANYGKSSKRGRKPSASKAAAKKPNNVSGFVSSLKQDLNAMLARADSCWLSEDDSDPTSMRSILSPGASVDDATVQRVEDLQNLCQAGIARLVTLDRELGLFAAEVKTKREDSGSESMDMADAGV